MLDNANISSLESTLSQFFECVINNAKAQTPFLQAMTSIYRNQPFAEMISFALDDATARFWLYRLK